MNSKKNNLKLSWFNVDIIIFFNCFNFWKNLKMKNEDILIIFTFLFAFKSVDRIVSNFDSIAFSIYYKLSLSYFVTKNDFILIYLSVSLVLILKIMYTSFGKMTFFLYQISHPKTKFKYNELIYWKIAFSMIITCWIIIDFIINYGERLQ